MGWSYFHKEKGVSVLDALKQGGVLSWSGDRPNEYKVLDSAVVKLRTMYVALEVINKETNTRRVTALVLLLDYASKEYYNFGYKDMDETCGPNESNCPERILKLLTPIDNEYANNWRARCQANIDKNKNRPKITPGCKVELYRKQYVIVESLGRKGFSATGPDNRLYRISLPKIKQCTVL